MQLVTVNFTVKTTQFLGFIRSLKIQTRNIRYQKVIHATSSGKVVGMFLLSWGCETELVMYSK